MSELKKRTVMDLKGITILTIIFFLFFSCRSAEGTEQEVKTDDGPYRIEVKINKFPEKVLYIGYPYGDKKYLADTAFINDQGTFVFEGDKPLDGGLYFIYSPNRVYFDLIVAEPTFKLETDTLDLVGNMKVEGSLENDVFFDFQKFMLPRQKEARALSDDLRNATDETEKEKIQSRLEQLTEEVTKKRNEIIRKYPDTFVVKFIKSTVNIEVPEPPKDENGNPKDPAFAYHYYKTHFFDNIDFSDPRMLRTPVLYPKIEEYMEKLTVKHPDSITVSAITVIEKCRANKEVFRYCLVNLARKYETSNIMGMDAVFVKLAEKYYLSGDAYWADSTLIAKIKDRVERIKPNILGKLAPKMVLLDTLMKPVSLYDINGGEYYVLFFYDPDCGHCKKKAPILRDLYNDKLKNLGVKVLYVDIKTDVDKWKKFISEKKIGNMVNLSDPYMKSNFRYEYNIATTPTIYILDKDKKILAKKLDVEQIGEFIDKQEELKAAK